jgi:4-amino-4-deoxy-L-arabinose transferase-like glycosyltransferase
LLGAVERVFFFTSMRHAIQSWIDHIEIWVAMCIVGSLWCFLRYVRTEQKKWLLGACAVFAFGTLVKEMAYMVPILAILLLWHERRLSQWKSLVPLWCLAFLALCLRTWALQGTSPPQTANGSWWVRMFNETIGGTTGAVFMRGDGMPLAVASFTLAIICLVRKSKWYWAVLWLAATGTFGIMAQRFSAGFEDSVFLGLLGSLAVWQTISVAILTVSLLWYIWNNQDRSVWFAWLWVVVTYLPLTQAPNTPHIFYIPSIGWALVMGFACRDIRRACLQLKWECPKRFVLAA